MVMFSISVLSLCFKISNLSTRIFVEIMSVLMVTFIGCCIWISWNLVEDDKVWQKSLTVLRRTGSVLFNHVKRFNPFHISRIPQNAHIALTATGQPNGVEV
jgi:hypothetical protein